MPAELPFQQYNTLEIVQCIGSSLSNTKPRNIFEISGPGAISVKAFPSKLLSESNNLYPKVFRASDSGFTN